MTTDLQVRKRIGNVMRRWRTTPYDHNNVVRRHVMRRWRTTPYDHNNVVRRHCWETLFSYFYQAVFPSENMLK